MARRRTACVLPLLSAFGASAWASEQLNTPPFSQAIPSPPPVPIEPPRTRWFWEPAELTEPLVTDRPDFTESTEAVPRGHVQLEMGYTFTYDRERKDRTRDHTAPEALLRLGLFDNFELRLDWPGYSVTNETFEGRTRGGRSVIREDWSQGANDFGVGFKYKIVEQDGLMPHFGVIAGISAPTGSRGYTSGDVDPELVFLWAYDINDFLAIAGNVGLFAPSDGMGSRFFQTAASLTAVASLTDELGVYVEYFGFYPNAQHRDCAHYLNGGFTYLITQNLQFDIRSGVGLNEEADDFFSGVGLSIRW